MTRKKSFWFNFNTHNFLRYISKRLKIIAGLGLLYIVYGVVAYIFPQFFISRIDEFMENLTGRIDHVTIWLAGLTFLYSAKTWRKESTDDERVKIILICQESGDEKVLPYEPMRRECTRAEIQGLLGLFHDQGRYENANMDYQGLLKGLRDVQQNKSNDLKIIFKKDEYDKFTM